MPVMLLLAMSVLNPESTQILFHDPTGVILTKTAAVLEVMAFTSR